MDITDWGSSCATFCALDNTSIANNPTMSQNVANILPIDVTFLVVSQNDPQMAYLTPNQLANNVLHNLVQETNASSTVLIASEGATRYDYGCATNQEVSCHDILLTLNINSQPGHLDNTIQMLVNSTTLNPQNYTEITEIESTPPSVSQNHGSSPIVGIFGGLLALTAIGFMITSLLKKKKLVSANNTQTIDHEGIEFDAKLNYLERLVQFYDQNPALYHNMGGQLRTIVGNLREFLRILYTKTGEGQRYQAMDGWNEILDKFLPLVDVDYYGNVIQHPEFWSESQERIAGVLRATRSVHEQVLENIVQLNNSTTLQFNETLESLTQTLDFKDLMETQNQ